MLYSVAVISSQGDNSNILFTVHSSVASVEEEFDTVDVLFVLLELPALHDRLEHLPAGVAASLELVGSLDDLQLVLCRFLFLLDWLQAAEGSEWPGRYDSNEGELDAGHDRVEVLGAVGEELKGG